MLRLGVAAIVAFAIGVALMPTPPVDAALACGGATHAPCPVSSAS